MQVDRKAPEAHVLLSEYSIALQISPLVIRTYTAEFYSCIIAGRKISMTIGIDTLNWSKVKQIGLRIRVINRIRKYIYVRARHFIITEQLAINRSYFTC